MSLSAALANIPGYGAYVAKRQMNEQQPMQELQQASGAMSLMGALQQQAKARQYEEAVSALGANPTQEALVGVASRFGSPDTTLKIHQASIDRNAQMQSQKEAKALQLEQSGKYNEMMHEWRMAQARTSEERAAEAARHNRVSEGLQRQLAELRGTLTPQPQMVTTPEGVFQVGRDAKATPVVGPDGPLSGRSPEKALPTAAAQKLFENQQNLRRAEQALALMEGKNVGEMKGDPNATGLKGFLPDAVLQRVDPQGTDARAALSDLGSLVIHERSGAAVTAAEFPRLQPFIPKINDDPETVKRKLKRFAQIYRDVTNETASFYKESGYKVPDLIPSAPNDKPGRLRFDANGNPVQ